MNDLPRGYRWATAEETEAHGVTPNPDMITVLRSTDRTGAPYAHGEADLALPISPLPRDEDGFIQCSASYGELWLVEITYNTDADNKWVDGNIDDSNRTLHGPFFTEDEADQWLQAYPEDTDVFDMRTMNMNAVRP